MTGFVIGPVGRWLATRGYDPEAIARRALGGVVLGLTVVAVDHVLRMGS